MTALRGNVVTADSTVEGSVTVTDGRIEAIRAGRVRGPVRWIVPGFVDIHVHGGGGHTFTTGDPTAARAAARFHQRHGTTTLLASLVTADPASMADATRAYAPLIADGTIGGIHFEGPYLSPERCGAQNPAFLRDPDLTELAALLDLGGVRMVTIAPERPLALDAIALLRERGVVAAIGHTDATYEQTVAAIDAGATVATHLGNAMRPIHHRAPGPIVALLDAPTVTCEQVADGIHLHDGMLRHVIHAAGPDRVALVTDAIDAAGQPDGTYDLGGQRLIVADRVARLERDGAIAGSTLTMDAALRRVVHNGVSVADAVRMAATTPARVIGMAASAGTIAVGRVADLVVLDEDLRVLDVLRAGHSVE